MGPRQRLSVWLVVSAATGCGVSLDLDPALRAIDAGPSVTRRDGSSADAFVDAPPPPRDASTGCPRDLHWPPDGTCGRVLFADAFDSTIIRSDWVLLRTEFAVVGGHLESLSQARLLPTGSRFDYGHGAHGRGGLAVLNVDGHLGSWTSYRVDWTAHVSSTDEAFTGAVPAGFSSSGCDAAAALYFRAQLVTESWNEPPGATFYNFGVRSGAAIECASVLGDWSIGAQNGYWIPGYGYSTSYTGFASELLGSSRAPGSAYPPYAGFTGGVNRPHDYAIEVRGLTIDAWVDGTHLATFTDSPSTMTAPDATPRVHEVLTSGGVAFTAAFDEPYWIDDVVVTELP